MKAIIGGFLSIEDRAEDRHMAARVLFLFLAISTKWWPGSAGDSWRLRAGFLVKLNQKRLGLAGRLELAFWELAERAVARAATSLDQRLVLADARAQLAVASLRQPEAERRERGLELLDFAAREMGTLLELGAKYPEWGDGLVRRESAEHDHGCALNNLAQAWVDRRDGDRAENLRKGIAMFEQAVELPARRRDPGRLLFSLHHLAIARRARSERR